MPKWKPHRSSDDPVLPCHKLSSSDREVTHFKCLDKCLKQTNKKKLLGDVCLHHVSCQIKYHILYYVTGDVWWSFSMYFLWSYLCFVVPHTDTAVVQASQHPWFCWVKIHTLHSVRPGCQPPLDVQPQRLRNTSKMWAVLNDALILYNRTAPY